MLIRLLVVAAAMCISVAGDSSAQDAYVMPPSSWSPHVSRFDYTARPDRLRRAYREQRRRNAVKRRHPVSYWHPPAQRVHKRREKGKVAKVIRITRPDEVAEPECKNMTRTVGREATTDSRARAQALVALQAIIRNRWGTQYADPKYFRDTRFRCNTAGTGSTITERSIGSLRSISGLEASNIECYVQAVPCQAPLEAADTE